MEPKEFIPFFKEQALFLKNKVIAEELKIFLWLRPETAFHLSNIDEIDAFASEYKPIKKEPGEISLDKIPPKRYSRSEIYKPNTGETSTFESFGKIYLMNSLTTVTIEFLKEFRSGIFFKKYSIVEGSVRFKEKNYSFKELYPEWENTAKNTGLTIIEASRNTQSFVRERCLNIPKKIV